MKLLQSVYVINSVTVLIESINIKGLNIRYRTTGLISSQWEIDIIFNILFTIVPPGLEPPVSEGTPLFLKQI